MAPVARQMLDDVREQRGPRPGAGAAGGDVDGHPPGIHLGGDKPVAGREGVEYPGAAEHRPRGGLQHGGRQVLGEELDGP